MGWALHESKGGGSRYSDNALENISLQIMTLEEQVETIVILSK